jgi:hypothetical protein
MIPISSQPFAGVDVGDRHREEGERDCHHNDVHHRNAPNKIGVPADAQWRRAPLTYVKVAQTIRALHGQYLALERIGIRERREGKDIGIS